MEIHIYISNHPEPSIFRSTIQIRRYPFTYLFAKETLSFSYI